MKTYIKILVLVVVGGLVFLVGFRCGYAWRWTRFYSSKEFRENVNRRLMDVRKQTIPRWEFGPSGAALVAHPLPPDFIFHQMYVERGPWTPFAIPLATNETCNKAVIASETNLAFALVETCRRDQKQEQIGCDFGRIIKIVLPQGNQEPKETEVVPLLVADDIQLPEGKSWITQIDGVSPDARYLLMTRAIPKRTGETSTTYLYRNVIFDTTSRTFMEMTFDKQ
jgi:hypothetical protein